MSETWRSVQRYEGYYSVSDRGRVRNDRSGRILKPWPSGYGNRYLALTLCNGSRKNWKIHRLVADAFLPRGEGRSWVWRIEVNHKDLDPHNNKLDNLEWVTRLENEDHKHFMQTMTPDDELPEALR